MAEDWITPDDDWIIPNATPRGGMGSQFVRGVQEAVQTIPQFSAAIQSLYDLEGAATERTRLAGASREIAEARPGTVERLADVSSVGTAASWFTEGLARTAPSMLPGIAGGVGGFLVGGPIGGFVGALLGAFVPNVAESFMNINAEGAPNPGASFLAGTAKAALDAIPTFRALRIAMGNVPTQIAADAVERSILRRAGREAGIQAGIEGVTEGIQTGVDILADRWVQDNWNTLTSDEMFQVAEATILGGGLGGVTGVGAGGIRQSRENAEIRRLDQAELDAAQQTTAHEANQEAQDARDILLRVGATQEGGTPWTAEQLAAIPDSEALSLAQRWIDGDEFEQAAVREMVDRYTPHWEVRGRDGEWHRYKGRGRPPSQDARIIYSDEITPNIEDISTGQIYKDQDSTESKVEQTADQFEAQNEELSDFVERTKPPPTYEEIEQARADLATDLAKRFPTLSQEFIQQTVDGQLPLPSSFNADDFIGQRNEFEEAVAKEARRARMALIASLPRQPRGAPAGRHFNYLLNKGVEETQERRARNARQKPPLPATVPVEERASPRSSTPLSEEYIAGQVPPAFAPMERQPSNQVDLTYPEWKALPAQLQSLVDQIVGAPTPYLRTGKARLNDYEAGVAEVLPNYVRVTLDKTLSSPIDRYTLIHELGGHALMRLGRLSLQQIDQILSGKFTPKMMRTVRAAWEKGHPSLGELRWETIEQHVKTSPEEAFAFYVEAMLWAKDNNIRLPTGGNMLQRAVEAIRRAINKVTGYLSGPRETAEDILAGKYVNQEDRAFTNPAYGRQITARLAVSSKHPGETLVRSEVPENLKSKFIALANMQRGRPESMFSETANPGITNATGLYTWALEHAGDLIHRAANIYKSLGLEAIEEKVAKLKRAINSKYGFEREVMEQLRSNYAYHVERKNSTKSFESFVKEWELAADKYAAEYKKLKPVTALQLWGKEAAIALGNRDYSGLSNILNYMDSALKDGRAEAEYFTPLTPDVRAHPRETLAKGEVENFNVKRNNDLERITFLNQAMNTPIRIAEKFPLFRPYMQALLKMESIRSRLMHHYLDKLKVLDRLPKPQLRNVTKFAEVMNSMRTKPTLRPDGSYEIKVPGYASGVKGMLNSRLALSRPGEVITLRGREAEAYTNLREALDEMYQEIRKSVLARFGLEETATAVQLRQRGAQLRRQAAEAEAAGDRAVAKQLERDGLNASTTASLMGAFDRAFLEGYIPQMRAGKAKLVLMQAKRNGTGGWLFDGRGDYIQDDTKQENPLTRTIVLTFDGFRLQDAIKRAQRYGEGMKKQFPESQGWVIVAKPNDASLFASELSPTDKSFNIVEGLAELFLSDKASKVIGKDEEGNVLTTFDLFMKNLHDLEAKSKVGGIQAQFRQRKDNAGWLRAENQDTYLKNSIGAYLLRAVDHVAGNHTYQDRKEGRFSLIRNKRHDLAKYANDIEEYIHTPDRFVSLMKGAAFNWFLGLRLSSAFVNFTQTLQTTIPYLSTVGGPRRAAMEVLRASKDIGPTIIGGTVKSLRGALHSQFSGEVEINWAALKRKLKPGEFDMLQQGIAEGWLTNVMTKEQSGAVAPPIDNPMMQNALYNIAKDKTKALVRIMPVFFSLVEQQNRMVAALAAYRLAQDPKILNKFQTLAQNSVHEGQLANPVDAARMATIKTQFMAGKINRPVFTRNPFGAIAFQFIQFPLGMFELFAHMLRGAGLGKKAATTFLTMAVIGVMMTSGLWGLPGMGDMNDLLRFASRAVGPILGMGEINLERAAQEFVSENLTQMGLGAPGMTPQETAEALVKGPWRMLAGVDISRRTAIRFDLGEYLFTADPVNLLGPAGAMGVGSLKNFVGHASHEQWPMAWASLFPMFVQDWVKAHQAMVGPGVPSPTTGNYRRPVDQRATAGEVAALAMGFAPTSYAREAERTDIAQGKGIEGVRTYYNNAMANALLEARRARQDGDEAAARAAQARFNALRLDAVARSRGVPPEERIWTPTTMRLINDRVQRARRGPTETAIRRRANPEERGVRNRLSLYPEP